MSLLFVYKKVSSPYSVLTLGGRWSRPRPIFSVSVIGPNNTAVRDAHLDTGADETIFSEQVAAYIGLDLRNAPVGQATTANLTLLPVRYAQVTLRITDGKEQRQWPAWVGFTPAKLQFPLLGFAGFLQFFTATFHGDREQVELTVNSLYPGT